MNELNDAGGEAPARQRRQFFTRSEFDAIGAVLVLDVVGEDFEPVPLPRAAEREGGSPAPRR